MRAIVILHDKEIPKEKEEGLAKKFVGMLKEGNPYISDSEITFINAEEFISMIANSAYLSYSCNKCKAKVDKKEAETKQKNLKLTEEYCKELRKYLFMQPVGSLKLKKQYIAKFIINNVSTTRDTLNVLLNINTDEPEYKEYTEILNKYEMLFLPEMVRSLRDMLLA